MPIGRETAASSSQKSNVTAIEGKTKTTKKQSKIETTTVRRSPRLNIQKAETISGVRRSDRLAKKSASKN